MHGDPQSPLLAREAVGARAHRREDAQRLGDQRMAAALESAYVDRSAGVQLHERLPTSATGDEDPWPAPPESVVRIGAPEVGGGRNLGQGDCPGDLPIGDAAHVNVGKEGMRRFRIRRGEAADDLDAPRGCCKIGKNSMRGTKRR